MTLNSVQHITPNHVAQAQYYGASQPPFYGPVGGYSQPVTTYAPYLQAPVAAAPPALSRQDTFVPAQPPGPVAQLPPSGDIPNVPPMGLVGKTLFSLRHPLLGFSMWRRPAAKTGDSSGQEWAMLSGVLSELNPKARRQIIGQIRSGRLFNTDAEDGRSTLAHLYQIAATPRAEGLSRKAILNDVVRLLAQPETLTQRFSPLQQSIQQSISQQLNSGQAGVRLAQGVTPDSFSDHSATCVSASVMYTLFSKQPSEVVRHIAELTSPKLAFTERAKASEISPDNPALAAQKLAQYNVPGKAIDAENYLVTVGLTKTGLLRAINQQTSTDPNAQSVVESAYQSALTKLAASNYEPGLGTLVLPDGKLDTDPGIVADQKTLMESIMKDTGPVMQVDYQVTAADRNNEPYLMGYLRPFERVYSDLVNALNAGHNVIIGIVDTDKHGPSKGRLNLKHEVTLVGHKDGMFQIADSDDDVPRLIQKSAKELIPQIHHAGLPDVIGRKVQRETAQLAGRYLTPDGNDAKNFKLIDTVPIETQPAFMADFQRRQMQELQQQQQVPPLPPSIPTAYGQQPVYPQYAQYTLAYPQPAYGMPY